MVDRCFDPDRAVKDALKLDKGKVTVIAAATALASVARKRKLRRRSMVSRSATLTTRLCGN